MRISVIGAGAMGGLFGALLKIAGHEVCLGVRQQSLMSHINDSGIRLITREKEQMVRIPAFVDPSSVPQSQLTIVFVKSMDTRKAAETARTVTSPDGWVATLQNGMGNADILAEMCDTQGVIAGTTAHGATLLGPGHIRHAGIGPTIIGLWEDSKLKQKNSEGVEAIARILTEAGIETRVARDVKRILWEKLLINVGINAVTALTGIQNGQIVSLAETAWIIWEAVEEAAAVARAAKVMLPETSPEAYVERVFQVARDTAGNRSSMGQDVDRRRKTEIEAINGVVVALGKKYGIPVLVNQTLYGLIRTLETQFS